MYTQNKYILQMSAISSKSFKNNYFCDVAFMILCMAFEQTFGKPLLRQGNCDRAHIQMPTFMQRP